MKYHSTRDNYRLRKHKAQVKTDSGHVKVCSDLIIRDFLGYDKHHPAMERVDCCCCSLVYKTKPNEACCKMELCQPGFRRLVYCIPHLEKNCSISGPDSSLLQITLLHILSLSHKQLFWQWTWTLAIHWNQLKSLITAAIVRLNT